MNISKQVVILSAELSTNTFEGNRQRTATLEGILQDLHLPFNKALGVYKGSEETSFVVIVRDETDIEVLRDFAFKNFGQESILVQDANQEAYLLYQDGTTERLGVLEQTTKENALKQDAYTLMNDQYYITRSRI